MSDDDISIQELEEQAWPEAIEKGGIIEHEFMDGTEMQFKVQDPETETIAAFIGPNTGDKSQSERQYEFCSATAVAPDIPLERWQEWREADRLALTNKFTAEIGLDRVVDFRADDLEELMSDSQDE